ncbi:hypothetical protein V0R50_10060 [Pseudomonas sp. 148P]|uniref:Uncharacterized protein n=1 Tax=Pseudomonas ulcerans TaxID=3115852 RepID=A0ABU7HPV8_9PSED|nr:MULTISPECIES: hypothetical protein [unclassified Pseudomonas]MEE1921980.1 hypothetical protein [Pseudomonas sp. 147P]MEE1933564.1 hypothetical protein [Pseudomonas sp. 148P]
MSLFFWIAPIEGSKYIASCLADIARNVSVGYCAETYERDLPRVDRQQTLDARYQGPRPLALARLTLSPAGPPARYVLPF